jgi:uncharacterized Zn-finger protein
MHTQHCNGIIDAILSFKCHSCGELSSGSETTIRRHRKLCTTTIERRRPFACSQWGKKFIRKYSLNVHLAICGIAVEDRQRFACPHCNKRFVRKDHLDSHLKICAAIATRDNKNVFQCIRCDINLCTADGLTNHERFCHFPHAPKPIPGNQKNRAHKDCIPYTETKCTESEYTKTEICIICHQQFRTKGLLTVHQQHHHKGQLFICSIPQC